METLKDAINYGLGNYQISVSGITLEQMVLNSPLQQRRSFMTLQRYLVFMILRARPLNWVQILL